MSRCLLLPPSGDLIAETASLLLGSGSALEDCLAVFPGKRPGHFLLQALARALGKPFRPPAIHSMDDWARELAGETGHLGRQVDALEAAALLAGICDLTMPGGRRMPLERFLPWGFKLFADLEELKMEMVEPGRLRSFDSIAGERLPPRLQGMLSGLSDIYRDFYGRLGERGLVTRSSLYAAAARSDSGPGRGQAILAGFFGPTASEEKILLKYSKFPGTVLLLKDGPGIEALLSRLGLEPERLSGSFRRPEVSYYPAPDTVGQAMALNEAIEGNGTGGRAVVLPAAEALFPVADHVLGRFGQNWNVSLGYPLSRTPLMALFAGLGRMLETEEAGRIHVPEYLAVLLHPYVKNLRTAGESRLTRMLCHAVDHRLTASQARFVDPAEIENDPELAEALAGLAASEGPAQPVDARTALAATHRLIIGNFRRIRDIGDFAGKLLELVSAVAEQGTAQQHPYAASFLECAAGELGSMAQGPMAGLALESRRAYFSFVESALAPAKVPYPGTPLRGLQVLGFLETRNLSFDEVFILDANEGVLPPHRQAETLLPQALRSELGLPDHSRAEAAARYHFRCLLAGAKRVHLFYRQGRGEERSRFIEELWWEEQKRTGALEIGGVKPVHFATDFGQRDPEPAAKTPEIMEALESRAFSPSSLDAYLRCPLQFLYAKVLGLESRGASGADLDQTQMGSLVHQALSEFFGQRLGREAAAGAGDFDRMVRTVEAVFAQKFGQHMDGRLALARLQVQDRMRSLLEMERARRPVIRSCERELAGELELANGRTVKIKGTIDRIEEHGGRTNIIDYKTGSSAKVPQKGFDLSQRGRWHRSLASLQLPLYRELYRQNFPGSSGPVDCGLMLLGSKVIRIEWLFEGRKEFPDALQEKYMEATRTLIAEILDPSQPFGPAPDPQAACPGCDFKVMCGRQWMR